MVRLGGSARDERVFRVGGLHDPGVEGASHRARQGAPARRAIAAVAGKALAALVAAALVGCAHQNVNYRPTGSQKGLKPLTEEAIVVGESDESLLSDVPSSDIGVISAAGALSFAELREQAASLAAEKGGTHIVASSKDVVVTDERLVTSGVVYAPSGSPWAVGRSTTRVERDTESRMKFIVYRVDRAHWSSLPNRLRPKPE